jgi:hypothetical protein
MFSQVVGRLLLPNLERDLTRSVTRQLQTAHNMADCMIAPTVHAFESSSRAASGAMGATATHAQRATAVVKVQYPVPGTRGLFQG